MVILLIGFDTDRLDYRVRRSTTPAVPFWPCLEASRKAGRQAKEIQYMLLGENGYTHVADNLRNYNSHGDALQQLRFFIVCRGGARVR